MSRTTFFKAQYFATMAVLGVLAALVLWHYEFSPTSVAVAFALLILPGRVLGFFWRDLIRGLRLLNARQFAESRHHSMLFLEALKTRPYLKNFVWLGSSSYSRNPEALVRNNLGAAELALGQVLTAKEHLEAAIQIDRECPLPFFNMGVLHVGEGHMEEAERCFQHAARLGYTNSLGDKLVRAAQDRLARTEG